MIKQTDRKYNQEEQRHIAQMNLEKEHQTNNSLNLGYTEQIHQIVDDYHNKLNTIIKQIEPKPGILQNSSNTIIRICDEQLDDNDELKEEIQRLRSLNEKLDQENKDLKRDQLNDQIHHKLIRESNKDLKLQVDILKEKNKALEFDQYCTLNYVDRLRKRIEKHGVDLDNDSNIQDD